MSSSSFLQALSQDSFRRQIDRYLRHVHDEQRQLDDRLLILKADQRFYSEQQEALHREIEDLRKKAAEESQDLEKLLSQASAIAQQEALLSDLKDFFAGVTGKTPRFFSCMLSDFTDLHQLGEISVETLVAQSPDGFMICVQDKHYCFLKDSAAQLWFHPHPVDPDDFFQLFVQFSESSSS